MWFSLFAVVLILAITFYQGLLGLFSSVINCILTIVAAALAFGLYENVYFDYLIDRQPEEGQAIALMAIFIVSLLVLRVIFDLVIKDNVHFPLYVDRVGGGVFGFVTAMIIIGTLSVAVQMLPFSFRWLGFSRYAMFDATSGAPLELTPKDEKHDAEDALAEVDIRTVKFVRQGLWLSPDAFAVGLASHLSDNALAGTSSLAKARPALLDDIYWARFNAVGQKTGVARAADAISVETCWRLPDDGLYVLGKVKEGKAPLTPPRANDEKLPGGYQWLAVRVKLTNDATDDGSSYRFTTNQVSLVTRGKGGRTRVYRLVGINAPAENVLNAPSKLKELHYRLHPGETVIRSGGRFDFVFEVPEDEEPWFVEFRRNARAEVRRIDEEAAPSLAEAARPGARRPGKRDIKPEDQQAPDTGGGNVREDQPPDRGNRPKPQINVHRGVDPGEEARSGGRTRRYTTDQTGSFFSNDLPFDSLTNYTTNTIEIRSDTVIGGQGYLIARLDKNDQPLKGNKPPLQHFDVPENVRLLQVSVRRLHPGSTLAQAMDFARQLGNVSVKDGQGKEYPAVGTWGIATVGRDRLFELIYFDETTQIGSPAPPKLDKIRRDDMVNDYALYYLFHIPPGKRIVTFLTPKGSGEDLRDQNLVAPN
ncbi:MAG: CvpA family protein [Planctomycetes bacterium]|nr:CvpA family protein [Planctomycetota bacterium]